jgi:hypothetical protein
MWSILSPNVHSKKSNDGSARSRDYSGEWDVGIMLELAAQQYLNCSEISVCLSRWKRKFQFLSLPLEQNFEIYPWILTEVWAPITFWTVGWSKQQFLPNHRANKRMEALKFRNKKGCGNRFNELGAVWIEQVAAVDLRNLWCNIRRLWAANNMILIHCHSINQLID